MKKVGIVDYGMGNLDSVARAVEECGGKACVTSQPDELHASNYIILPGVGSFAQGMKNIRKQGLDIFLTKEVIEKEIPILGVCLGMQLLATKGSEGGETKGLSWIDGEVHRLTPESSGSRIPHVGWNEIIFTQDSPLFNGIPSGKDFYFVHSYHFSCKYNRDVFARTPYCGGFASVIGKKNIFGVQFHPEKSQRMGFQVLKNFLSV